VCSVAYAVIAVELEYDDEIAKVADDGKEFSFAFE